MKKLLALLIVVVMLFCLAACTEKPSESDVRGEQTVVSDNEKDNDNDSIENNDSDDDDEDNDGFSFGKTSGLKYENKFIGIGCKLDSGWTFYTDEEIKELNNITLDLAGDELRDAIENATIIYDMYASNTTTYDTININLEKCTAAQLANVDLKQNYELVYPALKETFENMGATNISKTIVDMKMSNKTIPCLKISLDISGVKMYEVIFQIKCDGYIANIAIATIGADRCASILSKFYAL